MMVPEVMALLVLCAADAMWVIVCDHDENEAGEMALEFGLDPPVGLNFTYGILDDLPRLWFMLNLALLLSITIIGNISPPAGTTRGVIFDIIWSLIVSQLTAMMLQRTASRTKVIQKWLKHNLFLATTCGLSVLFCTHSLAMSLAIVFRQHEHDHAVPGFLQVWDVITKKDATRRLGKVAAFCIALCVFNCLLEPGMMESVFEAVMVTLLNLAALGTAISVCRWGKTNHTHSSWEASLILLVGSLGSFCWWSELFNPDHTLDVFRTMCISLAVVTHISLTALFADVFRHRVAPSCQQCLVFTFWSCSMLFMGAKLEHHAAVEHERHHRKSLKVWELLEHLGEFGVCEFGLISTMAWLAYLAQHAVSWWDVDSSASDSDKEALTEPLLKKHP